ncbi:MAG TPA: NADH:flavin oxidoreductase [Atribacteraceae bacterium]|nr:NADH:flavin oxidoreductase [Atribacteraceae bacterium]
MDEKRLDTSKLFSEYTLRNFSIKNRIVMPPMVCFGWSGSDGLVTEDHVRHYEARARGGTGLIIIEALTVKPEGRLVNTQLGIWSDGHKEGLKAIAEKCHDHGAVVIAQLNHAGLKTPKNISNDAISPFEYRNSNTSARTMTLEEIDRTREEFIRSAERIHEAGLDGVEIHGVHGYLLSQFASSVLNHRKDGYGGSINARMRLACEIVQGIRSRVGDHFIIGYRMGGNEPSLDDGLNIGRTLEACGVDILHVSSGFSDDTAPPVPDGFPYNWIVYCGTEIRKTVNVPVIVVNGIRTASQALYLLDNGRADFTAVGRGLLTDPEWANKARSGQDVNPCLECHRCHWFKNGKDCPALKQ